MNFKPFRSALFNSKKNCGKAAPKPYDLLFFQLSTTLKTAIVYSYFQLYTLRKAIEAKIIHRLSSPIDHSLTMH